MSTPVEKIKEKLGIVDVLGSYMTLEKAGANFKARCPFHNEKTPSFFVSPVRNSYYCFGCGQKGDIFTFVQEFEGLISWERFEFWLAKQGYRLNAKIQVFELNEKKCIWPWNMPLYFSKNN
jgi:DNA primase